MGSSVGNKHPWRRFLDRTRSQSEVMGVVLVMGMVILGALAVVGLGASAIGNTEDNLQEDRAEKTLTQFDSKAALVALGEAQNQEVGFPDEGQQFEIEQDVGTLRIEVTNRSTGTTPNWGDDLVNVTLGAVTYEGSDTQIAYQGGGVFRESEEGTVLVSPPEFHYRDGTLTFPIVNVSSGSSVGGSATVSNSGVTQSFPQQDNGNRTNPLDDHEVRVIIQSEYYEGWGHYFEERTDGEVSYDHDSNTVEVLLVTPLGETIVASALNGPSSSGSLTIQGNPGDPCGGGDYFNSYSSEMGSYTDQCGSIESAGELVFGGDISIDSNAGDLRGDLRLGGTFTGHPSGGTLYGNITHTAGACTSGGGGNSCQNTIVSDPKYDTDEISGVDTSDPIGFLVNNTVTSLEEEGTIVSSLSEVESQGPGEYYIDSVSLNNEDITLDTSTGNITIGVKEDIDLTSGSNITVVGDGQVEFHVDGQGLGGDNELEVCSSTIFAPDNDATSVTVLGDENFDATIYDGDYTGVIYAPAGSTGTGLVEVVGGGTVFGGVVTGQAQIGATGGYTPTGCGSPGGGAQGSIHYDRALEDMQVADPDEGIIRVTYLHVTLNQILIDGE